MIKLFAIIFLITALTAGLGFGTGLQSDLYSRNHLRWGEGYAINEKIAIQAASYDSTQYSLSVFVQSMNMASNNATFTMQLLKTKRETLYRIFQSLTS